MIVDKSYPATHGTRLLLLLLAVNLHDVINDVKVVIDCVPSREDILLHLIIRLVVPASSS